MSGTVVVLILGVLVIAYAVYFTHTVLRPRLGGRGGTGPATFEVGANTRRQVIDEVTSAGRGRGLSPGQLEAAAERTRRDLTSSPALRAARCLWVDHDPDGIVHERRMLELLRVEIDLARTTNQALQFLVGRRYDVVITDLTRPVAGGGVDDRAGIKLLKMLAGAPTVSPLVVYADDIDLADDTDEPADAKEAADDADEPADTDTATDGESDSDRATSDDHTDSAPSDGGAAGDGEEPEPPPDDPRLDDARAAGARAAVAAPSALLRSVLDLLNAA